MLRKSMYMCANFNVSRFDSLSEGFVGTIPRNFVNASLRLWVLCLSRTLAAIRWFNKYTDINNDFTFISLFVQFILTERLSSTNLGSGVSSSTRSRGCWASTASWVTSLPLLLNILCWVNVVGSIWECNWTVWRRGHLWDWNWCKGQINSLWWRIRERLGEWWER